MLRIAFVGLFSLLVLACASEPTKQSDVSSEVDEIELDAVPELDAEADADTSDEEQGPSCFAGVTRCNDLAFERCVEGRFELVEQCSTDVPCLKDVGCAQCNPAKPSFCHEGDVYACTTEGMIGALQQSCVTEPCYQGRCGDVSCAPETQVIYVIDHDYNLLSFDPKKSTGRFKKLAQVDCPAKDSWPAWGSGEATPFSMSVDRDAKAWVLFTSGEIFKVEPDSGACQQSGFSPGTQGFELFGMGFVSDGVASTTESLFIAGGDVDELELGQFARINPSSLQLQTVGKLPDMEHSPELTGTGNAKLFGYFPGEDPVIAEIDKGDGKLLRQWSLPYQPDTIVAWAFATWAGDFYIFETADGYAGYDSRVLRFDPDSGETVELESDLPWVIVGAGVSTCAPWN
ncbi:MAG: hypothetical protein RBU37_20340 [Myxococcota bacterium]|jgi:hypothetical protein|nr:hypothetical protein [Myxococcota bacterium]